MLIGLIDTCAHMFMVKKNIVYIKYSVYIYILTSLVFFWETFVKKYKGPVATDRV